MHLFINMNFKFMSLVHLHKFAMFMVYACNLNCTSY